MKSLAVLKCCYRSALLHLLCVRPDSFWQPGNTNTKLPCGSPTFALKSQVQRKEWIFTRKSSLLLLAFLSAVKNTRVICCHYQWTHKSCRFLQCKASYSKYYDMKWFKRSTRTAVWQLRQDVKSTEATKCHNISRYAPVQMKYLAFVLWLQQ